MTPLTAVALYIIISAITKPIIQAAAEIIAEKKENAGNKPKAR